jgi:signal transduction histidine kinase
VIAGIKGLLSLHSLIGVMILLPVCAAAQAPTKRVLILSGSNPNYPGFSIITQGIRSIIRNGSSSRIEFIYELQENLVTPPNSERYDQELVDYLSRKYEGKKIDLILAIVAPRLRVLLKHNPGLFADIPKIVYDFEDEREATIRDLGPNVTGMWAKLELTRTLDLALALQPEALRVVGSIVRFRQPSFWELYKWYILGLVAAFVIEALLIAWLLFTRARHRQAIVQLDKRVRFESLLSKLSAEFTDLPTSKVDTVVKQWLDRLKDFLGEVTISFFEVPGSDGAVITIPSEDRSPPPRALAVNDVKDDEWCLDQLRKGNTINLANVPAASSSEKTGEILSADLKSLLAIPFAVNGNTFGLALGTSRPWPEDQVSQLTSVGEIFAGAFERKRSGEELQKTRNELAHVARLTAMGEMAASIAHEVNQPLAAIATYGDACLLLLNGESPNVKKSLEAINHIISDSMRASEVIKRIRGLVKKTAHENTPQDLNQIILEMVALTDADMQARSVQLKLHLVPDLPLVLGDRVELQQVMLNLILNSIEAMSAIIDRARELTISSSLKGGGQVVVTVQDSGVGLNSEQARRIFDPFVTTKTQGLGLGLSISRTILQAHGGRLWAEPSEGPGATFQFTLPTEGGE